MYVCLDYGSINLDLAHLHAREGHETADKIGDLGLRQNITTFPNLPLHNFLLSNGYDPMDQISNMTHIHWRVFLKIPY